MQVFGRVGRRGGLTARSHLGFHIKKKESSGGIQPVRAIVFFVFYKIREPV